VTVVPGGWADSLGGYRYKKPGEAAFTGGMVGMTRERLRRSRGMRISGLKRESGRVFKLFTET